MKKITIIICIFLPLLAFGQRSSLVNAIERIDFVNEVEAYVSDAPFLQAFDGRNFFGDVFIHRGREVHIPIGTNIARFVNNRVYLLDNQMRILGFFTAKTRYGILFGFETSTHYIFYGSTRGNNFERHLASYPHLLIVVPKHGNNTIYAFGEMSR